MKNCKYCGRKFNDWRGSPVYCSEKCNFDGSYTVQNGCWTWRNANKKTGYGILNYQGKATSAHRASYQFYKGKIPEKMQVCHSCDNRRCVNPDHLFLGSKSSNMQDAINKGRFSNGEKHYISKLTEQQVKEIRKMRKENPNLTYTEIADIYGVSHETIYDIVKKRTWKHVI